MTRSPYPGLNYYRFEDADLFYGREEETRRMVGEILSTRLLVLFSPSGSGKTSLIQAGVRPHLEKLGYKTVYTRMEKEPIPSICEAVAKAVDIPVCNRPTDLHGFLKQAAAQAGKPLVIFLDQFEELFIVYRDRPHVRAELVQEVARIRRDDSLHVFLVLSIREDYFASLHEFRDAIPSIFQENANIRLKPFSDEAARRAVEKPLEAQSIGYTIEAGLTRLITRDLKSTQTTNPEEKETVPGLADSEGPGIEPIRLQIVCSELWNRRDEARSLITKAAYEASGGVDSIIKRFTRDRLEKIPRSKQQLMEKVFNLLKTPDNTKRLRSFQDLAELLKIKLGKKSLKGLLVKLEELGILREEERGGTTWYEFRHDYLVGEVVRWMAERKEKRVRRRLVYVALPGVFLFLALFVYFFIQYHTYYAKFANKDYPSQSEEIEVSRGFNLFKKGRITTGYFKEDLNGLPAENAIRDRLKISFWDENDWDIIAELLPKVKEGEYLYRIGRIDDSFKLFKEVLKTGGNIDGCFDALARIGRFDNRAIDISIAALKDADNYVRYTAAVALGNNGKPEPKVIEALMAGLKAKEWNVRFSAARALGNIGKPDPKVIEALMAALKDEDSDVRSAAAQALGKIGKRDPKVIEALMAVLKKEDKRSDPYGNARSSAAEALGKFGKPDQDVIEALMAALKDPISDVRSAAADALVKLGNENREVIEALMAALKDSYNDVRSAARVALGKLLQSKPDKQLIEMLQDNDSGYRTAAAYALAAKNKKKPLSKETLAKIDEFRTKDPRPWVRLAAWKAFYLLHNIDN